MRTDTPTQEPTQESFATVKSKICESCGKAFPAKAIIDGMARSLYRRKFCLGCLAVRLAQHV
jgi:hypothetical protein